MYFKKNILFISLLFISINAFAKETLVFALDIVRHGDRTATITIPKSPHRWKEGHGKLTPRGMQQMFQLGKTFRKRYVETYRLLPKQYKNNIIHVSSTDIDRTIISAQTLLFGLYPLGTGPLLSNDKPALPEAFQPIPIHIKDWPKTKTCNAQFEKHMPSESMKQKHNKLKNNYKRWSEATGLEFDHYLYQITLLGDALLTHKIHKAPMPPKLTKKDIDTIIKTRDWACLEMLKTKEIVENCRGKNALTTVIDYLQKAKQQKNSLKYVLLSDHESTVAQTITMLGIQLKKWPQYASNLNFLLFKTDTGEHIVKVSYNGEQLAIPSCGGKKCSLEQLSKLLNK